MAEKRSQSITIRPASLTKTQMNELRMETPEQFVKTREAKGGKAVKYVEVGYVIARLNAGISPVGWQFEVVEFGFFPSKKDAKEVWVKGRLTLKDRNSDYAVVKEQFGSHQHHANVFIGDTLKAAGSDALKKCASLLGIASDIYWQGADEGETVKATPKPSKPKDVLKLGLDKVAQETNKEVLKQMRQRTADSRLPQNVKFALIEAINKKLGVKDGKEN